MSACVGRYNNCGSRASFYVIDDERGFKEFENKEDAEHAHYIQSKLAMHNLAPLVFSDIGKIRYRANMILSGWGYITEIAEMMCCGGNEGCEYCEDIYDSKSKQVHKLTSKIYDLGMDFMDAHVGNVGYVVRKGKKVLVCIDCGRESVYDPDMDDNYSGGCSCEHCKLMRGEYA